MCSWTHNVTIRDVHVDNLKQVLLAYFGLLLLSEVALAFLVAACFSRARLAAIVGPVALFACCLPRYVFFGTDRNENVAGKKWASLSSVAAFCFGADVFAGGLLCVLGCIMSLL